MEVEFDFERLRMYQLAEEFVDWSEETIRTRLRRRSHLADQLHRAATSIKFNIAEGAGEFSAAEKIHFYRIACRSATECVSIAGTLRSSGLVDATHANAARALLKQIVSLLIATCHSIEARPGASHPRPSTKKRKD